MKYGSCYMDETDDSQICFRFVLHEATARFTQWLHGVNHREPAVLLVDILKELEVEIPKAPGIAQLGWRTPVNFEVSWMGVVGDLDCVLLPKPEKLHVLDTALDINRINCDFLKTLTDIPRRKTDFLPYPTKVVRSGPMTIAIWPDKTKTYVRIKDDNMALDDPEKAVALVVLKKLYGPRRFRKLFKDFLDEESELI